MKNIKQVLKEDRKPFVIASILMALGLSLVIGSIVASCNSSKQPETKQILKTYTDNRGLTSVIFTVNDKDTFGLDYLTPAEFDSTFPGQYYTGQIILPDYANHDSLTVLDGKGLTAAMDNLLQSDKGSDSDIDSVLHTYCEYYEGSYLDQFTRLKTLYPKWDSLQIDQAIKED